jgi:hypothetical protein
MVRLIILPVLLAVLFSAGSVSGHPADSITARFDVETRMLTVTVLHPVRDAEKHFIGKIEVELNGEDAVRQDFLRQADTGGQQAVYLMIDAGVGDRIEVTAHCNVFGKKSLEIKVAEKPAEADPEDEESEQTEG